MKKRFCVTLEYETEFSENVGVPGSEEIRHEKLGKMQQIMDALQSHQDYLHDFYKIQISLAIRNGHVFFDDFGRFIKEKDEKEVWYSFARHLQPETASYFLKVIGVSDYDRDEAEAIERERRFFLNHIGNLTGVNAWFKEIGVDIKNDEPGENAGIPSGLLVIGQLSPNGRILPLQGPGIQSGGIIREK